MRLMAMLLAIGLCCLTAPAFAGPLDDARQSILDGQPEGAMLVIDIGAIAANAPDEKGYTLLHYAAQAGSEVAVKMLLDRGADPAVKGLDGKKPIDLATSEAVRKLLGAG